MDGPAMNDQWATPVSRRNIALLAVLALFFLALPDRAEAAPLPAPQNVNVTPGPGGLEVSWDPVSGASSYEVSYRIAAVTTAQVPPTVSGPQIVGGAGTSITNFPWQVALLYAPEPDSFFAQFCGGSLVAPDWVVTAAHCVEGLTEADIEIGYGKSYLTDMGVSNRIAVDGIVVHNSWTGNFVSPGDIALLQLSQPVPGGQVIRVPSAANVTGNGETVWASGWGNVQPFAPNNGYANLLQAVEVEVLAGPSDPACEDWDAEYVGTYHVCAGASWQGTCVGDSGGPLARINGATWELAGVTSFGSSPAAAGCAAPGLPGVFSRVSYYGAWVPLFAPETTWTDDHSTTATSISLNDLAPGYSYEVRVLGSGPEGGTWSAAVTGTVGGQAATPPQAAAFTDFMGGDFDGDGEDEVAVFSTYDGTWWVFEQSGSQLVGTVWADFSTASGWSKRLVGDFSGDGKDDIAQFHPSNGTWWVSRSTGTSFVTTLWADFTTASGWGPQLAGDFTGDGKDDIANFHDSNGTWWISKSNGTTLTTSLWADFSTAKGWGPQLVGDFEGDGKDDIANFHSSNGTWWVSKSSGTTFSTYLKGSVSPGSGWKGQLAVDIDGDGDDDLVNWYPPTQVWAIR